MKQAPGPKGLPFVGSMFPALRDPLGLFLSARETYGDLVKFRFGPFDYYAVTDPEIVRHVLVENAESYEKSRNYAGLRVVLGDGLLLSEGDHWRRQRRLAQPAFHRDRLQAFAEQMARATRDHLDRWRAEGTGEGEAFDIHREMMRLTFRIVGLTLFSSDVEGDARDVGEAMDVAMHWANDYVESFVRIPPWIPTPSNLRFRRAKRTLDEVVRRIIEARRERAERGEAGDDLLGMLMASTDETSGATMTDEQLRDEVITMVLAGHETTANLLTWTFMLLSKHPDVEERVREEAVRVLGDRDPALSDVKQLELARRVVEEGLRLYPPAWVFERQAKVRDELGGFAIEPGAIVGICSYALHRHPGYWHNPEGFDPDRFLPERAASRPRYAYLPFGGGPRTCIGNHFAMMEAQILLAMIVRDFRIELDPSHPIAVDPVITLRPKHGVRVRRRPASPAWPSRPSSGCPAPRRSSAPRVAPA